MGIGCHEGKARERGWTTLSMAGQATNDDDEQYSFAVAL